MTFFCCKTEDKYSSYLLYSTPNSDDWLDILLARPLKRGGGNKGRAIKEKRFFVGRLKKVPMAIKLQGTVYLSIVKGY